MQDQADPALDAARFKVEDAASYDAVTGDFELFTERFSLPLAEKLVDLANIPPAARVLDVGCGTGVVCRLAARRHPGITVTAVDLSDGMLRTAVELCAREGLSDRILLRKEDAEHLQLPSHSFDRVLSLFALRHFPNPERALQEMLRVARPGAEVLIAVGSAPPPASVAFIRAGIRRVAETLQDLAGRAPLRATDFLDEMLDQHLGVAPPEQHAAWTHGTHGFAKSVSVMMRSCGFEQVRTTWIGQSSDIASIDDFWNLQATFSSKARKRLPAAEPTAVASLRSAFNEACARHQARGGRMLYRTGALVAIGRVP